MNPFVVPRVTRNRWEVLRRRRKFNKNVKYKLRENVGVVSSKNTLKTAMLNVDGLSDTSLADVQDFIEKKSPDVVFLLETKRRMEELGTDISVEGYDHFEVKRSDVAEHKPGGGIACYTRKTDGLVFRRHSPDIIHEHLEFVNNERVWLKIDSLMAKTAILSVYMGCQYDDDRHQTWNDSMYYVLAQEAIQLRSEGYRIEFIGDFNGHVGATLGQGVHGNNADINRNGQRFLSFLDTCDLRHINGECRAPGQPETKICEGLWTRQRGNSRSVIDFAGVSVEHVDSVISMVVDDKGVHGTNSDHNWITIILEDKFRRLRLYPSVQKKEKWDIKEGQDWSVFEAAVSKLLPAVDDATEMNVDTLASKVAEALWSAGISAIGKRSVRPKTSVWSRLLPPAVVSELKKKRELERAWKKLVASDWSQFGVTAEQLSSAEELYISQKDKVKSLLSNFRGALNEKNLTDRACFWSTVSGKVKQSTDITAVMSSTGVVKCDHDAIRLEVEKHLSEVFQGSVDSDALPKQPVITQTESPSSPRIDHSYSVGGSPVLPHIGESDSLDCSPNNWLGRNFNSKEIKMVAKTLLCNKACGWDSLPNEFLQFSPDLFYVLLSVLFNKIKDTRVFPKGWNSGRITLLHKSGLRVLLGNYRPITVLISLAGLYSKVLNARLISVVESHKLLGDIQGGFRKGRGCADNLFILHTLLWKCKAQGRSVHMAFVDISKAYDTVNREILWAKLKRIGISGKFLDMLKSMYSGDSVDTVVNGVRTRPVFLQRGLRQGCSLSPLLFNIYISDIGHDLAMVDEGFLLGEKLRVAGLLFADDIILVAKSAEGLRRLLSLVNSHCQRLKLTISQKKSQIISPSAEIWELFDEEGQVIALKQVLQYKYLGVETFSTMFRTCSAKLKKCVAVAKRYMFACLHLGKMSTDVVRISLATWMSIAVPSITHGCESILFSESKLSELESIEAQVAKRILGVTRNTSNVCVQTELGIKPIRLVVYLQQLKFFFQVLRLSPHRWVKVAMMDHLAGTWESPYLSYICRIRQETSLFNEPPTLRFLSIHLHQWALAKTNDCIASQSLPCVEPVTTFKKKPYVFSHKNLSILASFRLSNAGLGNRCPFPGQQSFSSCPQCYAPSFSEEHVLFVCPALFRARKLTGLDLFKTQAVLKGITISRIHFFFVTGRDLSGRKIDLKQYFERGASVSEMKTAWLAVNGQ